MYFAFIFLRMYQDYFFQRGFESVRAQFLLGNISLIKRKVVLVVIYLFNCDSSKSTFFVLNVAFHAHFTTVFIKKIGIPVLWQQYKDYKNIFLFLLYFDMYFFIKR